MGRPFNYLSLAGVLNQLGQPGAEPTIPLNLVADYAGASMHGALGVMFALFARERTGKGQLVDVAYLDSTISLLSAVPSFMAFFAGGPEPQRGLGTFDGSRPYYTTYTCSDGKQLSIGSTEPHLWHNFCNAVDRPDLKAAELQPGEGIRGPRPEQVAAKLSDTPGDVRFPTPMSGAHTDEILADLGYSDGEVGDLRAAGTV